MTDILIAKLAECQELGLQVSANALPCGYYDIEYNGKTDTWSEIGAIAFLSGEIYRKRNPVHKPKLEKIDWEQWLDSWLLV